MNESTYRLALYTWLYQSFWVRGTTTITFDVDFVAGNVVAGTFQGTPITQPFVVSHAATLAALAAAINALPAIGAAVTGARQITITGDVAGTIITIVGLVVTGGLVQPVGTIVITQDPRPVPVIRSDQVGDRPTPSYPFATYRFDSYIELGQDEVSPPDASGIVTVSGQRQATISVHYFGSNPIGNISTAYLSLGKPTVQAFLYLAGIAINEKGPVQNVTAMLETKYDDHATFDFYVGLSDSMTDNVGLIERVGLQGIYQSSTGLLSIGPRIIGV